MFPLDPVHVSSNRLEGSLADTPLSVLLDNCHRSLVTGTLVVDTGEITGTLELRAGAVDRAEFDGLDGRDAVRRLRALASGSYELTQRLPDLDGRLGGAAQFEGDIAEIPIIEVMQHCEEHALSCTIIIIAGFDRAEIAYRAGDIAQVVFNGERDDDRIVDVIRFSHARFRVTAPPLSLGIQGWPVLTPEPTAPFRHSRALAKGTNAPPDADAAPVTDAPPNTEASSDDDPTIEVPPIRLRWNFAVWVGVAAITLAVAVTAGLIARAMF